jgi:hypothetical protein
MKMFITTLEVMHLSQKNLPSLVAESNNHQAGGAYFSFTELKGKVCMVCLNKYCSVHLWMFFFKIGLCVLVAVRIFLHKKSIPYEHMVGCRFE